MRIGSFAGTIALAFACAAFGIAILWRCFLSGYFEERYPASLYFAHIQAVDADTSRAVDFHIEWQYEAITPFAKGSGPARISTNTDKSVTVALVGLDLKKGLPLRIVATGYRSEVIVISGDRSGIHKSVGQIERVSLRPVSRRQTTFLGKSNASEMPSGKEALMEELNKATDVAVLEREDTGGYRVASVLKGSGFMQQTRIYLDGYLPIERNKEPRLLVWEKNYIGDVNGIFVPGNATHGVPLSPSDEVILRDGRIPLRSIFPSDR